MLQNIIAYCSFLKYIFSVSLVVYKTKKKKTEMKFICSIVSRAINIENEIVVNIINGAARTRPSRFTNKTFRYIYYLLLFVIEAKV